MKKTIFALSVLVFFVVQFTIASCGVSPPAFNALDQKQVDTSRVALDQQVDSATNHNTNAFAMLDTVLSWLKSGKPTEQVAPKVVAAQHEVSQSSDDLVGARAQIKLLNSQLDKAGTMIKQQSSEYEKLSQTLSTVTKEKSDAIADRDDAKAKYDDSWFGGKTWRLIFWISGISILLAIATIILNIHTDIFTIPFAWIGKLLSPK